jgi:hypothetical protein
MKLTITGRLDLSITDNEMQMTDESVIPVPPRR